MLSFRPLPLLGNPHVQTILGNYVSLMSRGFPTRKRVVALADGDRVVLHETPPCRPHPQEPMVLLVHGLGGSHQSPYMERLTRRLSGLGWRVFRMDLRAAGAGARLARRFYNAACSPDIRTVAETLAQVYPRSSLAIVGASLGGNIVLKLAGEAGARPVPSLCAVVAIAPPIDLIRCSDLITTQPFYDAWFVHNLTAQVRAHQRHFPDLPAVQFPRRMILRDFDDVYTAPRWGYADALDYYRQASAVQFMPAIRVPTFILTARDDPFVAVEPIASFLATPPLEVHIASHGGHLGFLGDDGVGGIRWAETQVIDWLGKQMETVAVRPAS